MKLNSNLRSLYFRSLRDLYSLELQLISLVPEVSSSMGRETRCELDKHLTRARLRRNGLEVISLEHGISIAGDPCQAMGLLVERSRRSLAEAGGNHLREAIAIAMCDHIHHLVVSGYSAARVFARHLGLYGDVSALSAILEGEFEPVPPLNRWTDSLLHPELLPA